MFLFFDTETTGLPSHVSSHLCCWPRLVQLGWLLTDEKGKVLRNDDLIIRPDGFTIPGRTIDIHGITMKRALKEGVMLKDALARFSEVLRFSHVLIGHNVDYDYHVIEAEFYRKRIDTLIGRYPRFCTMKTPLIVEYCRLMRGDNRSNWPSLSELYSYLFNEPFRGAHDAFQDAKATAQCFFKLRSMGVL
jgi:DNA polymerase III epsilon subunit-like protein